jgi:hypothetical protein
VLPSFTSGPLSFGHLQSDAILLALPNKRRQPRFNDPTVAFCAARHHPSPTERREP